VSADISTATEFALGSVDNSFLIEVMIDFLSYATKIMKFSHYKRVIFNKVMIEF